MMFKDINTPALLIDKSVLEKNISEMQHIADQRGLRFRPHIKTHKSIRLSQMQLEKGACGVAVAKLSEAEIFAKSGVLDIQIDNQIVGSHKIRQLLALSNVTRISCAVDSLENAQELSGAFQVQGKKLDVFVEIDTGLHRSGLSEYRDVLSLCRELQSLGGLRVAGLLTHAGHAYSATPEEVPEIGFQEGTILVDFARKLKHEGIEINEISVGSTPTAQYVSKVNGVTELRAGNYIFNDYVQVKLGTVTPEKCALTVLASVISCPASGRAIIDAGSKSFSSDRGAHGNTLINGYGKITDKHGHVSRLSEEHGIILFESEEYYIGERIRVIPNHACATVNMFEKAYVVDTGEVIEEVKIDARGCVV
jgi:D-serine deaminase-like pyridoxal phosphate-dependent protein